MGKKSQKKSVGKKNDAKQILQWLGWADSDYLAARGLLIRGFLLQGTILANTAIEKYLKSALVALQVDFGKTHDVVSLYLSLRSAGKGPGLHEGFLRTLKKAYSLRYPDLLAKGFNISLAQVKILAELDSSVHQLRKGFLLQDKNGKKIETRFDRMLAERNAALCDLNAAFGQIDRVIAFSDTTDCFELRVLDNGDIMQAEYKAGPLADDQAFENEGLRPG